MKTRQAILGVLTVLLLASCKIIIKVPAGGSVQSSSGQNNCAAGQTCTVEVVDFLFSDTFTARAASGFEFKHWKKRDRGLCGGNSTPCQLSTTGAAGNEDIEAILATDEEFYLEPVFEATGPGDGPVSNQGAGVCFNEDLTRTGNHYRVNYRSENRADGTINRSTIEQTIVGPRMFKGKQGILARADITVSEGDETVVSRSDFYFTVDIGAKRSTNLGGMTETTVDGVPANTQEIEFVPGLLTRYDLAAGESYSQTYTSNSSVSFGGVPITDSQSNEMTVKYIGVVTVNVPAGSFQACKFEEEVTGTASGTPFTGFRTYYLAVGKGLMVKEESGDVTTVLVSGNIDGNPI